MTQLPYPARIRLDDLLDGHNAVAALIAYYGPLVRKQRDQILFLEAFVGDLEKQIQLKSEPKP